MQLMVGAHEYNTGGQHYYKVSDVVVHEGFILSDYINDIALIRVQTPIKFNDQVQPIKYTNKMIPPGTPLQTIGWTRLLVRGIF